MANRTITKCNVCQNDLTAEGARLLAECLPKAPTLTHLDINNNFVQDEGAAHFARIIGAGLAPGLKVLSLRNNGITDAGADSLAQALESCPRGKCNLTLLVLDTNESNQLEYEALYNRISPEAAERVRAQLLQKEKKRTFQVDGATLGKLFGSAD